MTLPNHLFVSSCDGGLYDTRIANWSSKPPLRANYEKPRPVIRSASDLKAALRYGGYAWPGGYPLYFVTYFGTTVSFEGARQDLRAMIDDLAYGPTHLETNFDESDLICEVTGDPIPAAYCD